MSDQQRIVVGAHPMVASLLHEDEHGTIEELEHEFKTKIIVQADQNLHLEQFDIVVL
ncbi:MAG: hypothetical protein IH803_10340 [Nitrospirae bacterium]|nr:hypothetical protein [Nitrospirota bacterium]